MAIIKGWSRCGNTPYYRSGEGLDWFYIDPFKFRAISTGMAPPETVEEGSLSVLYREAPRYDFEAAKRGISFLSKDPQEQKAILRALHEWASDQIYARTRKLPEKEIHRLFQNAPQEAQVYALNGVLGMIGGFREGDITQYEDSKIKTEMILVIPKASKAEGKVEIIEDLYGKDLSQTIIDDSIYAGLEQALSEFGIYEC